MFPQIACVPLFLGICSPENIALVLQNPWEGLRYVIGRHHLSVSLWILVLAEHRVYWSLWFQVCLVHVKIRPHVDIGPYSIDTNHIYRDLIFICQKKYYNIIFVE